MDPLVAVGVLAGGVLAVAWAAATRRHVRRRHHGGTEWDGGRTELWTSAARCPDCGAGGGLVEEDGDGLRFTCLRCGAAHHRDHRG